MTDAERRLWTKIRLNQINGYRFYRQKPIGDFIVDFYCPTARLVIEVDGGQHFCGETTENDIIRDAFLMRLGLRILRYNNIDILQNIEGVVENIMENVGENLP